MFLNDFLEGRSRDSRGRTLLDILSFDDDSIEDTHDFIQWVFPLDEESAAVSDAPVLSQGEINAIRSSSVARDNLLRSADWYLGFLARNEHWIVANDHNHLRITRAIKSLRLLVGDEEADGFRQRVFDILADRVAVVSPLSASFWERA